MDEQQLQQQIIALVQAAMQGDQQANAQIEQIMQAAQQGDQQAIQIAEMIQAVMQQVTKAQNGAKLFANKLNYFKQLKGICPEGYEMQMYRTGGRVCKKCMKKQDGGNMSETKNTESLRDRFMKCGGKTKKVKKEEGGSIPSEKCGGKSKMKKSCGGSKMSFKANGGSFVPFPRKGLN